MQRRCFSALFAYRRPGNHTILTPESPLARATGAVAAFSATAPLYGFSIPVFSQRLTRRGLPPGHLAHMSRGMTISRCPPREGNVRSLPLHAKELRGAVHSSFGCKLTNLEEPGGREALPDDRIRYGGNPDAYRVGDPLAPNGVGEFGCIRHEPIYPQFVDDGKSTICGLRASSQFVNIAAMSDAAPYQEIGTRLEKIREGFSDLSQKAWAEKHNFGVTQYNNWVKGARRIPVENAELLCDLYGLDLDFIYRGKRDGLSENARKVI